MIRKPLIAGNWKMHGTKAWVNNLLNTIKQAAESIHNTTLAVFPPSVFLDMTQKILTDSSIQWGAQNVSEYPQGSFTGEISTDMLIELGCRYVIIGHSERRTLYSESNAMVAKKFQAVCQSNQLTPIVCLGETQEQRQSNETQTVIKTQLSALLNTKAAISLNRLIIAYEPTWAIGTGLSASPQQAQTIHSLIRQQIAQYDEKVAKHTLILYGGSINPNNAADLFAMPDIDGGLIGGASLDANQFLTIARSI